jgi:hypothetical protein
MNAGDLVNYLTLKTEAVSSSEESLVFYPTTPPRIPEESTKLTKLRGRSPQANYTERATAACRRS